MHILNLLYKNEIFLIKERDLFLIKFRTNI